MQKSNLIICHPVDQMLSPSWLLPGSWFVAQLTGDRICLALHSNLDETAKSVFKENVRVTEALASHIDEADQLRDQVRKYEHENRQLRNDQELSEMLIQQKVVQSRRNKQTIKEVARLTLYIVKLFKTYVHYLKVSSAM